MKGTFITGKTLIIYIGFYLFFIWKRVQKRLFPKSNNIITFVIQIYPLPNLFGQYIHRSLHKHPSGDWLKRKDKQKFFMAGTEKITIENYVRNASRESFTIQRCLDSIVTLCYGRHDFMKITQEPFNSEVDCLLK